MLSTQNGIRNEKRARLRRSTWFVAKPWKCAGVGLGTTRLFRKLPLVWLALYNRVEIAYKECRGSVRQASV
jgi:hypothetical protein